MRYVKMLLLFLVFSLIIQNTCPYKMAAKTGFVAKEIHHCPIKKHSQTKNDADNATQKNVLQAGQIFVFTVGSAINIMQISYSETSGLFPDTSAYKNIFSEPPIKPPRSFIL
jgi:hypothetical protein